MSHFLLNSPSSSSSCHLKRFFFLLLSLSFALGAPLAFAATAVPPKVSVVKEVYVNNSNDPEFDDATLQATWQEAGNDNVWLCKVDPNSGQFIPASGKGTLLGKAAPVLATFNGPEFGRNTAGLAIYYTGYDANKKFQNFRYENGKTVQITQSPVDLHVNIATNNSKDPFAKIINAEGTSKKNSEIKFSWISEDKPNERHPFPVAYAYQNSARWIPGENAIVTNMKDANGVRQIARYDVQTGATTILSKDKDDKVGAFFFNAPEYNNEKLFFGIVNANEFRIYRFINNAWTPIKSIFAPYGKFVGGEPVVYKNRTYIHYATNTLGKSGVYLSDIYGNRMLISKEDGKIIRQETESLVTQDSLFIYYSDYLNPVNEKTYVSKITISN